LSDCKKPQKQVPCLWPFFTQLSASTRKPTARPFRIETKVTPASHLISYAWDSIGSLLLLPPLEIPNLGLVRERGVKVLASSVASRRSAGNCNRRPAARGGWDRTDGAPAGQKRAKRRAHDVGGGA
jgi:hypothetical protein